VVAARQQLRRTEVRAPFDGVVSERKVSAGDTAQIGKELVKVIDPRSMRFEGFVSADRMHEIKSGQDVSFRVNGYPDSSFTGKVKRVDAAANPTTRQVEVLVEFADAAAKGGAPRVSGLYAEGRIASGGAQVLSLPESSIVRAGDKAHVWRVNAKDKTLSKVAVQLGERDARRGEYPLRGGLAEGDQILRNPGSTLVDGQKIELANAPAVAPSAAASATAGS
jgi:RND family efflux transporter MFP subunit